MRNLELVYLAVAYGMAGAMYYITRHKSFPTISHTALDTKFIRWLFCAGLTLTALLFTVLMYRWAIPHYDLGLAAKVLTAVIALTQTLTGFIPVKENGIGGIHAVFATGLGISMYTLITYFALSTSLNILARAIAGLVAIGMLILLAISFKAPKGQYWRIENFFFALWHISFFSFIYFG